MDLFKRKDSAQIIEEIHNSFYNEADVILRESENPTEVKVDNPTLVDKGNRLKALGFINSKESKHAKEQDRIRHENERKNAKRKELAETVIYFRDKYPTYKFITEESVKKICETYGLVYGPASAYTGTVPEKNIKDMEQFDILDEDRCYIEERASYGVWRRHSKRYINFEEYKTTGSYRSGEDYYVENSLCPLEIAAPLSDFNVENLQLEGTQLIEKAKEIPDPVVLQPVFYKGNKHYLIVTAWGEEASDPDVMRDFSN